VDKGPKVQYDESDSESESEDEETSKEELIELLQEAHSLMNKKREEFKELRKRNKALEQTLEHLATHERLIDAHEKLKEAHSSLLAQKKEPIEIANVGVTCDILDESLYAPIIFAPTNPHVAQALLV
jgi:N12 class adenine-specific DNA methylase